MTEWISVNKELPLLHEDILIYYQNDIYVGYRNSNNLFIIRCNCHDSESAIPTHWIKLPKAPNE
jgi:hypothetical protein